MRVLLVEDEAEAAKTVELMLQRRGHECDTTAFGEEAVILAKGNAYDVIILDIMLPDIDGYEVLRRLRSEGVRTPVLVQSGLVDRDQKALGQALGFDDYLVKPFDQGEMESKIERVIKNAEQRLGNLLPPEDENEVLSPANDDSEIATGAERRTHKRIKVLRPGQIIFRNGNCVMDCMVIEMSEGGAALKPANLLDCPKSFTLSIKDGPSHQSEVCWQYGDKIGVKFLDT